MARHDLRRPRDELPVSAFPVDGISPREPRNGRNESGARNSCMGFEHLHSVRKVRHGCPHSVIRNQGLRLERIGTRARNI